MKRGRVLGGEQLDEDFFIGIGFSNWLETTGKKWDGGAALGDGGFGIGDGGAGVFEKDLSFVESGLEF